LPIRRSIRVQIELGGQVDVAGRLRVTAHDGTEQGEMADAGTAKCGR
jgi:hypothetical protein